MKQEEFWLFRNGYSYFKAKKLIVEYSGNCPNGFLGRNISSEYPEPFEAMTEKAFHLNKYEAKKWRGTVDDRGDVHYELLRWLYIEKK